MELLCDRLAEDLRLSGYSASTQRLYLLHARHFAGHFMCSPADLGESEARAFLLYLIEKRKLSYSTYRQYYAGLKFLYTVTLKRSFDVPPISPRRVPRRLPVVLAEEEVQALLDAFTALKYRTMAATLYAGGLRVSEACSLRVSDIDSKRMLIHIREGKGRKDRYVMLATKLLHALRRYWVEFRPAKFLFEGNTKTGHVMPESIRSAIRRAAKQAGITKTVTPHVLRHSFATHLLESGTDIRIIQALLGHSSVQITARYASVSKRHIQKILSPLDLLGTQEKTAPR